MKHKVSPVVSRRDARTELIRKVQKGNNEKLIIVLILTVHIQ